MDEPDPDRIRTVGRDDPARVLSHEQARRLYDRIGARLDSQSFYEDRANHALIEHADFGRARRVFEFGCGTGRLAEEILAHHLSAHAEYRAIDVSATMVGLARQRLVRFGSRARVDRSDGSPQVDAPDGSFDRFVSTYVLDLLSPADIRGVIAEGHRLLAPAGRLCLASLGRGRGGVSRIVSGIWSRIQAARPQLVGGCRPIELLDFVGEADWRIEYASVISAFGVPSEVLVAAKA